MRHSSFLFNNEICSYWLNAPTISVCVCFNADLFAALVAMGDGIFVLKCALPMLNFFDTMSNCVIV